MRTIEALRTEVRELRTGREEALANQQRELSQMYASLSRRRDEALAHLQRSTGESAQLLETRLEELRGECARLASELSGSQRAVAALEETLSRKANQVRQLGRELEDGRLAAQKTETAHQQELERCRLTAGADKEKVIKEMVALQADLAQARQVQREEVVARESAETILRDARSHTERLVARYEEDLAQLRGELLSDRTNLRAAQQSLFSAVDDCKLAEERLKTATEEHQRVAVALENADDLRRQAETSLALRTEELEDCMQKLTQYQDDCERLSAEKEDLSRRLQQTEAAIESLKVASKSQSVSIRMGTETGEESEMPPVSVPQTPDSWPHATFFTAPAEDKHSSEAMALENVSLRAVVSDLRREIEQLRTQVAVTLPDAETADELVKVRSLLVLSTEEVARLRSERRKLIDLSNSLRAALQERSSSTSSLPPVKESPEFIETRTSFPAPLSDATNALPRAEQLSVTAARLHPSLRRAPSKPGLARVGDRANSPNREPLIKSSPARRRVLNYAKGGDGD